MVVIDGSKAQNPKGTAARIENKLKGLPDVTAVTPAVFNQAGDTAVLRVIPASGPSSTQTKDLVAAIRDVPPGAGAEVSVTGATAFNIDISAKLGSALVPYLALVIGLAFLLLMVVFRSVLVPLKATLGFLLTVGSTFGAVVAVFQWGWLADLFGITGQTGPVISMLPVFLVGIVFGLAMDYQVFLVTRMREQHVHGAGPIRSVVDGFSHSARGLLRLHPVQRDPGPRDRPRPRLRRLRRRLHRPDDHRPRRDGPPRQVRLVAPQLAQPPAAQRRHRRRLPPAPADGSRPAGPRTGQPLTESQWPPSAVRA
ncbi:MMPL family transporter [Kribbella qitaiheensis]|uniref:MMPL family transporter n=1 Tax=Kribbella qitaiheensis TaxID=1544730 RepID=UPI001FE42C6E